MLSVATQHHNASTEHIIHHNRPITILYKSAIALIPHWREEPAAAHHNAEHPIPSQSISDDERHGESRPPDVSHEHHGRCNGPAHNVTAERAPAPREGKGKVWSLVAEAPPHQVPLG